MKFHTYSGPKNVCGYKQTKLKITIIHLQVHFEIHPHLFAHAMWINILRNINIYMFFYEKNFNQAAIVAKNKYCKKNIYIYNQVMFLLHILFRLFNY